MTIVEFITARVDEDQARATAAIESLRSDSLNLAYDGDLGSWEADSSTEGTGVHTCLVAVSEPGEGGGSWEGVQMVIFSGDTKPTRAVAAHIAAEDPGATLRRCTLVRSLAAAATAVLADNYSPDAGILATDTLADIAAYWNTHPDYRSDWEPVAP